MPLIAGISPSSQARMIVDAMGWRDLSAWSTLDCLCNLINDSCPINFHSSGVNGLIVIGFQC
jgi:hypothetical protein